MDQINHLEGVITQQKAVLAELEMMYQDLEDSDLVQENKLLKETLEKSQGDYQAIKGQFALVAAENSGLKNALYEQMYQEKLNILNLSAKKLAVYFKSHVEGQVNELTAFEQGVQARITAMTATLKAQRVDLQDEIYGQ